MRSIRIMTYRIKSLGRFFVYLERPIKLYAIEGIIIAFVVNLIVNNNNLFATRLGADDFHLGLVSMLPQLVNMVVLIPAAILTDSLKTKRKMVIFSIGLTGIIYFAIGFVPMFQLRLAAFIGLLALSGGTMTIYNLSWQSFFPEVIPIEKRNKTLTIKTYMSLFISIITPLLTGAILSRLSTNELKIMTHQVFFFCGSLLIAIQIIVLRRMTSVSAPKAPSVGFNELKEACVGLIRNKAFVFFACVAWFFYIAWHMDWTLFFIGQTKYLKLNETQLGIVIAAGTLAQFLTLRFWSRMNERKGVVYTLTFGLFGLSLVPLAMITATILPVSINKPVFILFHTIVSLSLAAIQLNPFQCLLEVLDEKYKTISISIFTVLTCLSNAVMPFTGVMLYRAFGGDLKALHNTLWIVFVLRLFAGLLWLLRWKVISKK